MSEKFDVRCVVGPGPEQTAALGAAIRAAGFNPTTHRVTPIGLPPSYDVTEVIDAVVGEPLPAAAETPRGSAARTTQPASAAAVGASSARATGATAVATPPEPRAVAQDAPIADSDTRSSWLVAAVVGLALVLVAIVFVLFVL